jgi:hypothetical protein
MSRRSPERIVEPAVLAFATERQRDLIVGAAGYDSDGKAAAVMGCRVGAISQARARVRTKAAGQGLAPEHGLTHPAPEGTAWNGATTLYRLEQPDPNGRVLAWVRTKPEHAAQIRAMRMAVEEIADTIKPAPITPRAPKLQVSELLAAYVFGDPHGGMFARAKETRGADYDLAVFEGLHVGAVDYLASIAPPASTALLLCVGDLLHANDPENRTARAGHALDVDTRFAKVASSVTRTWVRLVYRALERHTHVRVILATGNHDPTASYWISMILAAHFKDEPRVTIDDNAGGRFHYYRHGRTLLGCTHGDMAKGKILGEVMSRDQATSPDDFRHWYTGHLHTDTRITLPSCTVDVLPTLAPGDAWSAAMGYRSPRSARLDVWSAEHGQISSQWVTPERAMGRAA